MLFPHHCLYLFIYSFACIMTTFLLYITTRIYKNRNNIFRSINIDRLIKHLFYFLISNKIFVDVKFIEFAMVNISWEHEAAVDKKRKEKKMLSATIVIKLYLEE